MLGKVYLAVLGLFVVHFGKSECNFIQTMLGILTGPQELETNMDVPEIIALYGYPVEIHTVTTEDGYILSHHRIPHGKIESSQPGKPVILQHGFLLSSACWVWNTPGSNLPFMLADAGYDVWITNIRGNEYGLKHTTLDPSSREFWKFSWAEMAKYDMPATIDYILKITGEQKLSYIGFSMGSTMAFVMLSTKLEYNNKIKGLFALAPVATMAHAKGLLTVLGNGLPMAILKLLNHGELPFDYVFPTWLIDTVCSLPFTSRFCAEAVFTIIGDHTPQGNQTRLDLYLRFFPQSTSVQVLEHYGQSMVSKRFAMFDYNFDNQKFYNQSTPPDYELGKISVPVSLFWADNDWLGAPEDVEILASKLKTVVLNKKIDFVRFGHADFLIGKDVGPLVYTPLIEAMALFAP